MQSDDDDDDVPFVEAGGDLPGASRRLVLVVKSTSSTTENGFENCTHSINNINTSDEDNNHDTNYINKFHDANHDTRNLHL